MTEIASALASKLHAVRRDQLGRPSPGLLNAVVTILLRRWPHAPAEAIEAAWLHDAMEELSVTPGSLLADGISLAAVLLITRLAQPRDKPYAAWIEELCTSRDLWAIRIKLAESEHRSSKGCVLLEPAKKRHVVARSVLEGVTDLLAASFGVNALS